MRANKERWFAFLLLLTTTALACTKPEAKGKIIAMVGDEALTLNELLEDLPEHVRSDLSSIEIRASVIEWINEEVLYQEAMTQKLHESAELRREFENLKKELVINRLIEQTLNKDISVSEQEIQTYYDANKEGFVLPADMVHAYHILVSTRKQADQVRKRLKAGEPFEKVAREVGEDTLANLDWDWGYFAKSDVIPEISKVVFKLAVNSYSFPVKSDLGFHVFKVVDKQKKGDIKQLDAVTEEIRMKLQEKKKQDKYQRFLLQMKSKYKIQTNFQLLDSAVLDSLLYRGA
ncbi:MAG: peptidylprolyl isomerase [bacterium]